MGGRGRLTPGVGSLRLFCGCIRVDDSMVGFRRVLGLVGVVVSLVLLLSPVDSRYADPCGSILVPARSWYSDGGELVHRNTPPCRDARMARLWWAAPIGVVGLVGVGFALRPRRHPDAENS